MNNQLKSTPAGVQSIFKMVTVNKKVPNQNAASSKNNNNNSNHNIVNKSDSASNKLTPKININSNSKIENPIASGSKTQIDSISTITTTSTSSVVKPLLVKQDPVLKRPRVFKSPTKKPSPPSLSPSSTSSSSPYSSPEKNQSSTLAYHQNNQNINVQQEQQQTSKNLNFECQNPASLVSNQPLKNENQLRIPKIIKVGEKRMTTCRENDEKEKENNSSVLSSLQQQPKQSSVKDELDGSYMDSSFYLEGHDYEDYNYGQNQQQENVKFSYKEETNNYNKQIDHVLDKTVTRCRAKNVVSQLNDQKKQVANHEAESQRKIHRMKEILKQMDDLGEELKVLLQNS